jgi:hypothetical protein
MFISLLVKILVEQQNNLDRDITELLELIRSIFSNNRYSRKIKPKHTKSIEYPVHPKTVGNKVNSGLFYYIIYSID